MMILLPYHLQNSRIKPFLDRRQMRKIPNDVFFPRRFLIVLAAVLILLLVIPTRSTIQTHTSDQRRRTRAHFLHGLHSQLLRLQHQTQHRVIASSSSRMFQQLALDVLGLLCTTHVSVQDFFPCAEDLVDGVYVDGVRSLREDRGQNGLDAGQARQFVVVVRQRRRRGE